MKKLLATALISLVTVGTASADFSTDIQNDSIYSGATSSEFNANALPATASGRSSEMEEQVFHGGMQDHPSERNSGI